MPIEYPWQQTILDAVLSPFDTLAEKNSLAEISNAHRLRDPNQPDDAERTALYDGVRALRVLIAEFTSEQQSHQAKAETRKGDIA